MKAFFLIFSICLITLNSFAQNTITLEKGQSSPKASINEVSWIAGHWQGEAFGGIADEIWSPPLGKSMMCVFRLINDDQVSFYEIVTITEENETLILRLKHFHADLKGWEEKDETVDFRLVKVDENRVYFEGFTFEKISAEAINIYVMIGDDDGKAEEVKFAYHKVKSAP
jgi:hypothetical protein